jgi:hypothetical protein
MAAKLKKKRTSITTVNGIPVYFATYQIIWILSRSGHGPDRYLMCVNLVRRAVMQPMREPTRKEAPKMPKK